MAKKAYDKQTNKWVFPEDLTPEKTIEDEKLSSEEVAIRQLKITQEGLTVAKAQLKLSRSTNLLITIIAIPFILGVVIAIAIIMLGGLGSML